MTGFVYILTNPYKTVLYTGVTNDIRTRLQQHRKGDGGSAFVKKYKAYLLMYIETYDTMLQAIMREKSIKGMTRAKKVALIEAQNPEWCDRTKDLLGFTS